MHVCMYICIFESISLCTFKCTISCLIFRCQSVLGLYSTWLEISQNTVPGAAGILLFLLFHFCCLPKTFQALASLFSGSSVF